MDKLVPWVHFVPFTCQDEDGNIAGERCEELLSFFKRHDDLAQKIAENGQASSHSPLRTPQSPLPGDSCLPSA